MPTPRETTRTAQRARRGEAPRSEQNEAEQFRQTQRETRRSDRPRRATTEPAPRQPQERAWQAPSRQQERARNQSQRPSSPPQQEPSSQRRGSAQSREVRSFITRWRMYGVAAFAVIMVLGGVVGLLFFARPTTSAVEMRNLTQYPEFTVQSFLNGSYFTDVSLWYADTYPLREPMVAADHAIDGLFGINTGSGMVGGNVKADEIPVDQNTDSNAASNTPTTIEPPADPPDEHTVDADIQANIMSGVFVHNGAAYNVYYFSQEAADTYVAALNKAVERLGENATVYSVLAPASSVMLSDDLANAVGGSDQQQTLDYLRTRFDSRVKPVELIDVMKEHRDEYLYFHTDHHWTQLGAYYAYEKLCEAKGVDPVKLDGKQEANLGELRGTFYDTIAAMGTVDPDEMIARIPNGTNALTYWDAGGQENDGSVINEAAADWDPSYKYLGFIEGDRPLEIIKNPKLDDGSSCLVVKDSYGCAFVPNLVDSYEEVHVIDFRETDRDICDYALENEIDDVIFLMNMKIGLSDTVAQTLLAEVS